jgi:Protein of unknown function (DUF3048) N-terminal domain/Protein of unknown function (DUF3048) C-terminal domain
MSLRAYLRSLRKGRLAVAGVVILAVVALIVALVVNNTSTPPKKKHNGGGGPRTTQPHLASDKCPLTDLPAPRGVVPDREPIAVKIGNEPGPSRPQSGLNEADIVYDTPAEGGIMRYIAVFQCQSAANIGPIRSVRWVDWHILQVFPHVVLSFVGGVTPNQQTVASLPFIDDANEFLHYAAYHDNPARTAPDATYSTTAALWALFKKQPAPPPIFRYTGALPTGAHPASQVAINFSYGTDVIWKWDASTGQWVHTYSGVTDIDALTGKPVTTTNIIVEVVHYTFGPYVESTGGSGDVESQTVGRGRGFIFRNGEYIPVIWHRPSLNSPTTYVTNSGQPVGLQPGRTWVELLLDTTYKLSGAFRVTP